LIRFPIVDEADIPESAKKQDEDNENSNDEEGDAKPKKKAPAKKTAKKKADENGEEDEEEEKPKRKRAVSLLDSSRSKLMYTDRLHLVNRHLKRKRLNLTKNLSKKRKKTSQRRSEV